MVTNTEFWLQRCQPWQETIPYFKLMIVCSKSTLKSRSCSSIMVFVVCFYIFDIMPWFFFNKLPLLRQHNVKTKLSSLETKLRQAICGRNLAVIFRIKCHSASKTSWTFGRKRFRPDQQISQHEVRDPNEIKILINQLISDLNTMLDKVEKHFMKIKEQYAIIEKTDQEI